MDKKAQLLRSLGTDSNEMISKDEAIRMFKQYGLSEEDTKKEFEKLDVDNDGELPRSVAGRIVDALEGKLGKGLGEALGGGPL